MKCDLNVTPIWPNSASDNLNDMTLAAVAGDVGIRLLCPQLLGEAAVVLQCS